MSQILDNVVCGDCGCVGLCMVVLDAHDEESLVCCDCSRIAHEVSCPVEGDDDGDLGVEDDIDPAFDYQELSDDGQPSEYDEWQDYMGGDDNYADYDE